MIPNNAHLWSVCSNWSALKMTDLGSSKSRLVECLREKAQKYWDLMKSWCKRRITKEDFDAKAKGLLGENNIHLHNEFLFAILVKCQTGTSQPDIQRTRKSLSPAQHSPIQPPPAKRPKPLKPKITLATELPYGALDTLQYQTPQPVQIFGKDLDSILLCSHELMLPEVSTLHARMLLGAWEADLDGVSEESAQLLLLALKSFLKNVLQALISHCTSWRLNGQQFQHSFGSGLTKSRNSVDVSDLMPKVQTALSSYQSGERGEAEVTAMLAVSSKPKKHSEPLTLFNLRDTLLVNPQCIPVHSIYACNMERILAGMWHPSQEEEEHQQTVEQWRKSLQHQKPFTISIS